VSEPIKIRELGGICPRCRRYNALSVWAVGRYSGSRTWQACDYCDYDEQEETRT
jgi:hypothetical protein